MVLVDVHFAYFDGTGFFAGDFFDQWRNQFARPTPFRPEINQDGLVAVVYFTVKVRFVKGDGVFHHEI